MKFSEFLPDASLAFILWTFLGVLCASVCWLIIYSFLKLYSRASNEICFEHIIVWIGLTLVVFISVSLLSRSLFNVSLTQVTHLNKYLTIGIFSVLTIPALWLVNRYIHIKKLFYIIFDSLTPLIWLFAFMFIILIPLSIYKNKGPENKNSLAKVEFNCDPKQERPNIILVIMDTLTAQDMQVYDYERPTTPFISEWAKDAIVFDRAYASSNWTTPTTMTIMTGQRPWTHKVWYRAENKPVSDYKDNILRVLSDCGYKDYSYVQNNHAHPDTLGLKNYLIKKERSKTFWIPKAWWVPGLTNFYYKRRIVAEWVIEGNPILKPLKLKYFYRPIF